MTLRSPCLQSVYFASLSSPCSTTTVEAVRRPAMRFTGPDVLRHDLALRLPVWLAFR
jgi:hypothetical protein